MTHQSAKRLVTRYSTELVTRHIGTCGFCDGVFKVQKNELVLHGYKRPGTGFIEGRCPGGGLPPYEISPKTAELGVEYYTSLIDTTTDTLSRMRRDPLKILVTTSDIDRATLKLVPKSMPILDWVEREYKMLREEDRKVYLDKRIALEIERVENQIKTQRFLLTEYKKKVDNWQPKSVTSVDEFTREKQEKKDEKAKRLNENRQAKYETAKQGILSRVKSSYDKLKTLETKYKKFAGQTIDYTNKKPAQDLYSRYKGLVDMVDTGVRKLKEILNWSVPDQDIYKDLGIDDILKHLKILEGGVYNKIVLSSIPSPMVGDVWTPSWLE